MDISRDPSIGIQKEENERKAIYNLREALKETNGEEIPDLFYEFEGKESYEAKVTSALDK